MNIKGVLISVNVKGSQNTFEASGVFLESNLVLITGTVLLPLIEKEREWVTYFVKSSSSGLTVGKHTDRISFRVFKELVENDGKKEKKLIPLKSEVAGVWKCPVVTRSVDKLFYDWTLGHVTHNNEARVLSTEEVDLSKELMSIFILLKCKEVEQCKTTDDHVRILTTLLSSLEEPDRGEEVEVVSTPFGNELFINSLSRGVISNVIGERNSIILFDARTVSGCEGGPIFTAERSRKKGKLIGLVSCPLTWWRGEWIGLTIGISLMPVLKRLLQTQSDDINFIEASINKSANRRLDSLSLQDLDEIVVLVRSGMSWGSGVVLNADEGTIITCSHVVRNKEMVSVFHQGNDYPSRVVFKSREDVAYDLAIIETVKKYVFK